MHIKLKTCGTCETCGEYLSLPACQIDNHSSGKKSRSHCLRNWRKTEKTRQVPCRERQSPLPRLKSAWVFYSTSFLFITSISVTKPTSPLPPHPPAPSPPPLPLPAFLCPPIDFSVLSPLYPRFSSLSPPLALLFLFPFLSRPLFISPLLLSHSRSSYASQ